MALITVSGHLFDPSGAATAGSVTFQLTNYGASIPRVIGTNSVVATNISFVANSSGFWTGSIQGNDTIDPGATQTPATTFYEVSFKDVSGNTIATLPFQFTGTGAANLDTQGPMNAAPPSFTPPNNAALLAGSQTFSGSNTFTGGFTAIAGQNQLTAFNINGILTVDGIKYVKTAAGINQAITDANAAGGGIVALPVGTYTFSGPNILLKSNVTLMGAGYGTFLTQSSPTDPIIDWATNNASNAGITDMVIDGASLATAQGKALNIGGTGNNNFVRNCWIQNWHCNNAALYINGGTQHRISNNWFANNFGAHTVQVFSSSIGTPRETIIENNHIINWSGFGVSLWQSNNNVIVGNQFIGTYQQAHVSVTNANPAVVTWVSGSTFSNLTPGMTMQIGTNQNGGIIASIQSSTQLTMTGAITGAPYTNQLAAFGGTEAVNVQDGSYNVVSDNQMFNSEDALITLFAVNGACSHNAVTCNHLQTAGFDGILVDSSANRTMDGNTVVGNTIISPANDPGASPETFGIRLTGSGGGTGIQNTYVTANHIDGANNATYPVSFSLVGTGNVLGEGAYINCSTSNIPQIAAIATPTTTLKKGTGAGDYSTSSTSYVNVDGTNLSYTVVIPTGWKLEVASSFDAYCMTASANLFVALQDTSVILERELNPALNTSIAGALNWIINGDGASHTINLQYKTSNAADSANLRNSSATITPTIVFKLYPTN